MLVAKDFRRYARESLKNRWIKAGGVAIVAALLGANIQGASGFGSTASNAVNYEGEAGINVISQIPAGVFAMVLGIGLAAMIYALILFVIGGAATLGYAKYNLNLVDDRNPRVSDVFSQFDRIWQGFVLQFLRGLYIFLWSLLFVIPGIIASYRYSMAAYILCENPEMTANEAITESKRLMTGNKWRLFCLEFSFFGWLLLAALGVYPIIMLIAPVAIMGASLTGVAVTITILVSIAYLVVVQLLLTPYMEASVAVFYREITENRYSSPVLDAETMDAQTAEETVV